MKKITYTLLTLCVFWFGTQGYGMQKKMDKLSSIEKGYLENWYEDYKAYPDVFNSANYAGKWNITLTEYETYKKWVAAGKPEPEEPAGPPTIPPKTIESEASGMLGAIKTAAKAVGGSVEGSDLTDKPEELKKVVKVVQEGLRTGFREAAAKRP